MPLKIIEQVFNFLHWQIDHYSITFLSILKGSFITFISTCGNILARISWYVMFAQLSTITFDLFLHSGNGFFSLWHWFIKGDFYGLQGVFRGLNDTFSAIIIDSFN